MEIETEHDPVAGERQQRALDNQRADNYESVRATAVADAAAVEDLNRQHAAAVEACAVVGVALGGAMQTAQASKFELERSLHVLRGRGHNPPGCPECGLT